MQGKGIPRQKSFRLPRYYLGGLPHGARPVQARAQLGEALAALFRSPQCALPPVELRDVGSQHQCHERARADECLQRKHRRGPGPGGQRVNATHRPDDHQTPEDKDRQRGTRLSQPKCRPQKDRNQQGCRQDISGSRRGPAAEDHQAQDGHKHLHRRELRQSLAIRQGKGLCPPRQE